MKGKQKTPRIVFCKNNGPVIFVYLRMLKILSYLNIALALTYFVAYLMNSYSFAILGVLLVIVHSAMVIAKLEQGNGFALINYILGGSCLVFAAFLSLWVINVFSAAYVNHYLADVRFYLLLSAPFALSILLAFTLLCLRKK